MDCENCGTPLEWVAEIDELGGQRRAECKCGWVIIVIQVWGRIWDVANPKLRYPLILNA